VNVPNKVWKKKVVKDIVQNRRITLDLELKIGKRELVTALIIKKNSFILKSRDM